MTAAPAAIVRHPWLVVTLGAAGLAAWMGLSSLHDFQHADSLLTVLISTQRWTPFFWGQDRFGMLVPLLATSIHDPLANLLFQGWTMTVGALLAPLVMARFLKGRSGSWLTIGALANAAFMLIATASVQFDWFVTQPYGISIAIGFAGLTAADERRGVLPLAAAFLLVSIASWINITIVVALAIAAVMQGTRKARLLTLSAASAAASSLASRYLAEVHTITALAPAARWTTGWRQLLVSSLEITANRAAIAGLALAAIAAVAWLWKTQRIPVRPLAAIAMMALGTWLLAGSSLWIAMNGYAFRYMYPTWMIVGVGASTVFAALVDRRRQELSAAALALAAAVAMVSYGRPSLDRVERGIDERFGRQTAAVLRNGATVIAGDYWRVWPAVFHANLSLARTHTHARVFGLTFRSEATDRLWKNPGGEVLIAGWTGDRSVGTIAVTHGIGISLLAHLPDIDLYTGRP